MVQNMPDIEALHSIAHDGNKAELVTSNIEHMQCPNFIHSRENGSQRRKIFRADDFDLSMPLIQSTG
ncbi:hypothetical protein BLL37_18480 [Pseudomonas azotoformans]|uniref:Uncharacterized protein n=1 Tax=Pseudomonas azotoformans TaxID=47878 RepID=A0A1V2JEJ6_PSEAZ|nr:hypothetical protein BFL39_01050 [Pseudomonas azotoformans]ONH43778.1 hypothetical protein BLL37_18480 [Pseudomonas azotoformans]